MNMKAVKKLKNFNNGIIMSNPTSTSLILSFTDNCFMMSGVSVQRIKMFDGVGQSEYRNIAQSTLKNFNPTVYFTVIGIIMLNKLSSQFRLRF